ncbi:hypothetical protein EV681_3181 [Advenella incenata]|uniref:Uncharacterized protein n=1 Tax=Advenella incenata TaxID=267800 RepID=A0A4Q7VD98_9BURK|nr:hypothetical protein EV681_3181 [Advenella incenata]
MLPYCCGSRGCPAPTATGMLAQVFSLPVTHELLQPQKNRDDMHDLKPCRSPRFSFNVVVPLACQEAYHSRCH